MKKPKNLLKNWKPNYKNNNVMDNKLKQSVVEAWNEAEELQQSLSTLSNDEIIKCRQALIKRAEKIMSLLTNYVCEKDVQELNG